MSFDNAAVTAILAIGALTYGAVAVVALVRLGIRERLGRALALYSLAAGVWETLLALWNARLLAFWQAEFQARLPLYGALALAVIGLYLSQAFLRLEGRRLAAWWVGGGLYLAALIVLDSNAVP